VRNTSAESAAVPAHACARAKMIGKALVSTKHPILVHMIPCGNAILRARTATEFDDSRSGAPKEMEKRLTRWRTWGLRSSQSAREP